MGITEYDPDSVMHYTIPPSWLLNPKLAVLHRNDFLSDGDKKHAILCYGPKNDSGTSSKSVNTLTISPSSSSYDSLSLSLYFYLFLNEVRFIPVNTKPRSKSDSETEIVHLHHKFTQMENTNNTNFAELKQMIGKVQTTLGTMQTTLGTVQTSVDYLQVNMPRNQLVALHQMELHKNELKEDIVVHACQCGKPSKGQFYTNDGNKAI